MKFFLIFDTKIIGKFENSNFANLRCVSVGNQVFHLHVYIIMHPPLIWMLQFDCFNSMLSLTFNRTSDWLKGNRRRLPFKVREKTFMQTLVPHNMWWWHELLKIKFHLKLHLKFYLPPVTSKMYQSSKKWKIPKLHGCLHFFIILVTLLNKSRYYGTSVNLLGIKDSQLTLRLKAGHRGPVV